MRLSSTRSLSSRFRFSLCAGILTLVSGCAGGTLKSVSGDSRLPKELPKEMIEKFEVKEVSSMSPSSDPATAPSARPLSNSTAPGDAGSGVGVLKTNRPAVYPRKPKTSGSKERKPLVTAAVAAFAYPSKRPVADPMWLGEQHVFSITYFGMAAGELTLDVLPYKELNSRKAYHVRGTAVSSKVFSLFYRLNDTVETFMDYDGLFSHRFHLLLDESKQTRDSLELNDSEKGETYYWNRWNHVERGLTETQEFKPMTPFSQDSLSALMYLRFVPLPDGAVINIPVMSEGRGWEAVVTVLRREVIQTPLGSVRTVVVKPETKYQGVLKKSGDSFLWLTDDDRRFIVRLEAKVKIGTVVATLKEVKKGTPPDATHSP